MKACSCARTHAWCSSEVWSLWCWLLGRPGHRYFRSGSLTCLEEFQNLEEHEKNHLLTAFLQINQCYLKCKTVLRFDRDAGCGPQTRGAFSHSAKVFSGHEVLWKLKAYNSRVVCAWLAYCSVANARANPSPSNLLLAACVPVSQIHSFMRIFPKRNQCTHLFELGLRAAITTVLGVAAAGPPWSLRSAGNNMQNLLERAGRYLWLGLFLILVPSTSKKYNAGPICLGLWKKRFKFAMKAMRIWSTCSSWPIKLWGLCFTQASAWMAWGDFLRLETWRFQPVLLIHWIECVLENNRVRGSRKDQLRWCQIPKAHVAWQFFIGPSLTQGLPMLHTCHMWLQTRKSFAKSSAISVSHCFHPRGSSPSTCRTSTPTCLDMSWRNHPCIQDEEMVH